MAILESLLRFVPLLPLTPSAYDSALKIYHFFCIALPIQLSTTFYPTGKTSLAQLPLNVPGKPGWIFMELISPLCVTLAIFSYHPNASSLWAALGSPQAKVFAGLYYTHYLYRSLISPLLNPSMAPINLSIVLVGIGFNAYNGTMIGSWLAGVDGSVHSPKIASLQFLAGLSIWALGLAGNVYHESILRAIRQSSNKASAKEKEDKDTVVLQGRVYKIPNGGLFDYALHAHYFSEWVEWTGMWIATGMAWKNPILLFVVFEVSTMLPRALQGRRWYQEKFGDRVQGRKAAVPFLI